MTYQAEILERFTEDGREGILYLPDLTLWYDHHNARGTLPEKWDGYSLPQITREMNVPTWLATAPYRTETPGVEIVTTEQGGERVVRTQTRAGSLLARWTLGPDGDWWQVEYPVKNADDLNAVLELAEARTYVLQSAELKHQQALVGEDGVVAIEIPRRPYSDLLHEFLGWGEGLFFLSDPRVEQVNRVLDAELQRFVQEVVELPGTLVLSPDNLDGQFVTPRAYQQYLADSYAHTVDLLDEHGKRLVVHIGGPIRHLVAPLAEAGVCGLEGIAGAPQSDMTLTEAREATGPRTTLWGGIPQDYLLGTHDWSEFEATVMGAARDARKDGRMILGVADRIPVNSELSRLEAIPELAGKVR
jgi:hypothetical protein